MLSSFAFILIVLIVLVSALYVAISSNLIYSAISLLFTLFGVAGLYVFLYADFLAATQVIIYVGGILVLIIFGVMLTNKIDSKAIVSSSANQVVGAIVFMLLLILQFGVIFSTKWVSSDLQTSDGTVRQIGNLLLSKYLLPFEVVSVLLLAALIGASMLSRKS
tara:strand:- start:336 stop:824 length:489 start_codon:yes stop_codon:yes gene_type:complete